MAHHKADLAIITLSVILPLILLQQKIDLHEELQNSLQNLNISVKHANINHPEIVVFARVPKTGSLAINTMLEFLRDMHNYSCFSMIEGMPDHGDTQEHPVYRDEEERKSVYETLVNFPRSRPVMLARHVHFFDYGEFFPEVCKFTL